jgi:hypothetical protein
MSRVTRKRVQALVQLALVVLVLGYAGRALARYWSDFRSRALGLELDPRWIAVSGVAFLLGYLVLVQTWRAVLAAWSSRVSFVDAAHIFAVSSLARYVPGKLWQIGAMSALANRIGASPAAAAGSAIVSTAANIATGLLVALATGWPLVHLAYSRGSRVGFVLVLAGAIGLVAAPWMLPRLLRLAERVAGRSLAVSALPMRAVVYAALGNVLAWIVYGVAFEMLTRGVLGAAPGPTSSYVAVYTTSYIFGYLVLFAPAGVGFRESAMILIMPAAGLANPGDAAIMAVASRLWLTLLETVPGLLFLVARKLSGAPSTPPSPDANT